MKPKNPCYSKFALLLSSLLMPTILLAQRFEGHDNWPQFRGVNASGVAHENAKPPIEFNLKKNLQWKMPLPKGHSSPCVWGDNIVVTGCIKEKKELQTLCIDRLTGQIKWVKSLYPDKLDGAHSIGNQAQSTPVVDESGIFMYFGSYGVVCYDYGGNLQWEYQVPNSRHGMGTSASLIIVDDVVIVNRDNQREGRHLLAINKKDGQVQWKVELEDYEAMNPSSWSTPVHFENQIILHRANGIAAFNKTDGLPLWNIRTLTAGESSPVVSDSVVFVCTWHNLSEKEFRGDLPMYREFGKLSSEFDANNDGFIHKIEMPSHLYFAIRPEVKDMPGGKYSFRDYFKRIDKNSDNLIDEKEWYEFVKFVEGWYQDAGLIALTTNGHGTLNSSDILWKQTDKLSEVPTPLIYQGRIYMIKNGGWLTCMELSSGQIYFRERLKASGPYFASPIAANGYIYIPANKGVITVIEAANDLNIIQINEIGERIFATPAIVGDCMYVRTTDHLYAFGNDKLF